MERLTRQRRISSRFLLCTIVLIGVVVNPVGSFSTAGWSTQHRQHPIITATADEPSSRCQSRSSSISSSTQLNMFMGSDGGILGVGGPELFTILLVGYFVLGPSDLYKIVKEVGKFVQNARSLGTDLTTTLESNMESTLQLEEIRKAQRELTDAFSFRRSINVDQESDAFSVEAGSSQANMAAIGETGPVGMPVSPEAGATAAAAAATSTTKKRKIRRRVKRREPPAEIPEAQPPAVAPLASSSSVAPTSTAETPVGPINNNIPDLDMPSTSDPSFTPQPASSSSSYTADELATIESEFDQYTDTSAATSRFQQQLSGQWNDHILKADGEDGALEPVAWVMEQIAVLDAERTAAQRRLDEEYAERQQVERDYYERKRKLLEQSMAETQAKVFAGVSSSSSNNSKDDDSAKDSKNGKQVEKENVA